MHQTLIQFPDIQLRQRDGHKLRGYFAELFRERSTLLHNHFEDGTHIYRYPVVQYKVIDEIPTLVGIGEGARLLIELFLEIKELAIESVIYPVLTKHIKSREWDVGVRQQLYEYQFTTPWMALNQKNYRLYTTKTREGRREQLNRLLRNHVLSFYKGINYFETETILTTGRLREVPIQFKNQPMKGFVGSFTSNALLPDFVGLGKSVSRGFGTLRRIS